MGVLNYSNTLFHFIMSIAALAVGVYLILINQSSVGIPIIATAIAAWFVPGAAKHVATTVVKATAAPTVPAPQSKVSSAYMPPTTKPPAAG